MRDRQEPVANARQALGAEQIRAAHERGAAMTLGTAAEFAVLLSAPARRRWTHRLGWRSSAPGGQELVTLVAQGRTDARIAEQLYISVRTVRSHLDRIRDKTGCRRRADLTRLDLQASLVYPAAPPDAPGCG